MLLTLRFEDDGMVRSTMPRNAKTVLQTCDSFAKMVESDGEQELGLGILGVYIPIQRMA